MVTRQILLSKLPPVNNKVDILVEEQTTTDIITELCNTSMLYQPMYDNICNYFYGPNISTALNNLWDFVKKNWNYKEDSNKNQNLYAPNVMLSNANTPGYTIDCKNYSLFIYGILCGLKKKNGKLNPLFRFVSFNSKNSNPTHVYVVCNGYVLDCCTNRFDKEEHYEYFKDLNPGDMAINRISGINGSKNANNLAGQQIATEQDIIANNLHNYVSYGPIYKKPINRKNYSSFQGYINNSGYVVIANPPLGKNKYEVFFIEPINPDDRSNIIMLYGSLNPAPTMGNARNERWAWMGEGGKQPKPKPGKHGKKPKKKLPKQNNLIPPPVVTVIEDTNIEVKAKASSLSALVGLKVVITGETTGYTQTENVNTDGNTFSNLAPDTYDIYLMEDLGILGTERSKIVSVVIGGEGVNPIINNPSNINVLPVNPQLQQSGIFSPKNVMIGGAVALFGVLLYNNKK